MRVTFIHYLSTVYPYTSNIHKAHITSFIIAIEEILRGIVESSRIYKSYASAKYTKS